VGWPVSITHDLPMMGLPACDPIGPDASSRWQSFAEPADTSMTRAAYARFPGLDGQARGDSAFLCTNPITGGPAPIRPGQRQSGHAGSRCNDDRRAADPRHGARALRPDGFLMIGPAPNGPLRGAGQQLPRL
jgi:hypothetical protein